MCPEPETNPKSSEPHKAGSAQVAELPHGLFISFLVIGTDMQSGGNRAVERGGSHPKAASLSPPLGLARNSGWLQGSRCAFFVSLRVWKRKEEHRGQKARALCSPFQRHACIVPCSGIASASTAIFSKGINRFFFFFFRALACFLDGKKNNHSKMMKNELNHFHQLHPTTFRYTVRLF